MAALVLVFLHALEIMIWAGVFKALVPAGELADFEAALYFSFVTFTTLGYGDITLNPDWRLLASFEAANGIIMFGWTTALIVAYLQRIVPISFGQGGASDG